MGLRNKWYAVRGYSAVLGEYKNYSIFVGTHLVKAASCNAGGPIFVVRHRLLWFQTQTLEQAVGVLLQAIDKELAAARAANAKLDRVRELLEKTKLTSPA